MRYPLSKVRISPPGVILGLDFGPDIDDINDPATAIGMAYEGEIEILAVAVSSLVPKAGAALRGILNYAGMNNVPLGVQKGLKIDHAITSPWPGPVATMLNQGDKGIIDFEEAVRVMRRALAASARTDNLIMEGGAATNVAELLKSPADDISALTGSALVAAKCAKIAIFGGHYPSGSSEYNVVLDPQAMKFVAENSPVPVWWATFEPTTDIRVAPAATQDASLDPFRYAYTVPDIEVIDGNGKAGGYMTAMMLWAVRGDGTMFTTLSGTMSFTGTTSANTWTTGTGTHKLMLTASPDTPIEAEIERLMQVAYVPPYSPAAPTGLAAAATYSTTVEVAFNEALGSTGYQYRLNGGTWTGLDKSNRITGLTPSTSYTIALRGIRPGATGTASADLAVTTAASMLWTADTLPARKKLYRYKADPSSITDSGTWTWDNGYGGPDAIQATAARKPTYNATGLDGTRPSVNFTDDYVTASMTPLANQNLTFVWVGKLASSQVSGGRFLSAATDGTQDYAAYGIIIYIGDDGKVYLHTDGTARMSYNMANSVVSILVVTLGNGMSIRLNGTLLGSSSSASPDLRKTTRFAMGSAVHVTTEYLKAEHANVLMLTDLTADEIEKIEGAEMEAIGYRSNLASGHPYRTAAPTI